MKPFAKPNNSQQQVLPDGEALVALGREDGIEQRDQIQTLGDVEQGGGITESGHLKAQKGSNRASRDELGLEGIKPAQQCGALLSVKEWGP